jgi:NAD(P)-dependent dehydrogenase (short-subunit alcohol dehydrogenase family)
MPLDPMTLKGKVAIVTGGRQGIGLAIANALADAGADVLIGDIEGEDAIKAAKDLTKKGVKSIGCKVDVADKKSVEEMVETVISEFGHIDILVNNAGVVIRKNGIDTLEEEWDWLMGINLKGPFLCSKAVVPHFIAQNSGRIINLVTAQVGVVQPERAVYNASKTGLAGLTRALAVELAPFGIRVNAIGPGWTLTEINKAALSEPELLKEIQSKMPLARMADAKEVGALAAFLASPEADYITGQVIFIDGGWTVW